MPNNHVIGVSARRPAGNAITIATPVSPQPPGTTLLVNGSFSGSMSSGTLVWRSGGANVGSPVAITTIGGGTWSTQITTPATPGSYTLRAAFNGASPTADSGSVTVQAGAGQTLASFTFTGTGDGPESVATFGHSFPQGALMPTDQVLIRRADNSAPLRTQMRPLATWEDGSVRTALLACELPDLATGAALQARFRRGEAHASPGPTLTWAAALTGRSIVIRTWQPGNTTTPLWTYDVGAALPSSTDNWFSGPLAISRRVRVNVPASAVRTTTDAPGTNDSMRLVVDVTATKDGALIVDSSFRNDAVVHPNLGVCRFGYTIEIDGQIVYDQRPATGVARDMLYYCWWTRRRGKRGARVYDFYSTARPLFAPDFSVLVASRFQLNYDTSLPPPSIGGQWYLDTAAGRLEDPYWNWRIARGAGAPGGRGEIGYRTSWQYRWLINGAADPLHQLFCNYQAEAFAIAGWTVSDAEFERPVLVDEWVRFNAGTTGAAGASRTAAWGPHLPRIQSQDDHMTIDQAHRGPFYATTALLEGRRQLYDLTAMRSAEATYAVRNNNGTFDGHTGGNWRNMQPPNPDTGIAWTPAVWAQQTRGLAWGIRDIFEAQYILPDDYPRRDFYALNLRAYIGMYHHMLPQMLAFLGEDKGLPILHTFATVDRIYMTSFLVYGMTNIRITGWGGPHTNEIYDRLVTFRSAPVLTTEKLARLALDADSMFLLDNNRVPFMTWQAVSDAPENGLIMYPGWVREEPPPPILPNFPIPPNGGVGSDYNTNALNTMALMARWGTTVAARARARDALVLMRSHRTQPNSHPRVNPNHFHTGNAQTNQLCPEEWTWRLDTAPVLQTPAAMSVAADAPTDTLVGLIDWTGPIPRMTDNPVLTNHDSFQIVSQPAGNPFRVTRGGSVRLTGTAVLALGPNTLQVRCRTFDENGVERWSNTVTVTVNATAVAPQLSANQSVTVPENGSVGQTVATFTYTGTTGAPSITAGNGAGLFDVVQVTPTVPGGPNTIRVRIAASLLGQMAVDPTLTIQVTNPAGSTTATCAIDIVAAGLPPVITTGQSFTIPDDAAVGTSPTPTTVAMTGDPPTAVSLSGTHAALWAITTAGVLTTTAPLGFAVPSTKTLTVTASNFGGSDSEPITINVTRPTHAWTPVAQSGLLLGAWSVARVLVAGYSGPLIRVRRASDNVEQDFGASGTTIGSLLNTAAITAFIGSSQGFATRVYDQLYGNHLVRTVANGPQQHQITAMGGAVRTMPGTNPQRPCIMTATDWTGIGSNAFNLGASRARYAIGAVAMQTHTSVGRPTSFMTVVNATSTERLLANPVSGSPPAAFQATRITGGTTNLAEIATGAQQNVPVAVAVHLDADGGANNSLRAFSNSQTAVSPTASTTRLGMHAAPNFEMAVVVGWDAFNAVQSRHHMWSEGYLFADITPAHVEAVIAEQRAFYGF